jgi:transposase-like protein
VTDAVLEDVRAWQSRPLSAVYPILYFEALFVKTRQEGPVATKAIYLALGINLEGEKELLGLWVAPTEGSKFWLTVFNELKTRGAFPNDEAIIKIIYLAIQRVAKKWTMPIRNWRAALNQFVILFVGTISRSFSSV